MKYIRNFSAHTDYEAEMSKIPTPSVSYCRKENECHFMPSNVIMFKVGDLNGNTNQTVTVNYDKGSETIPITEGNKWYVHNIPSGKSLYKFVGIYDITDTIISAKLAKEFENSILSKIRGNVSFIGCDTSEVTSMYNIFYLCAKLTSLDVTRLVTSKVTDLSSMFYFCRSLKTLDVSNWDTSKVTDMRAMFYYCSSLQALDVSNWNVSNVIHMGSMFHNCGELKTIYMRNCNQTTIDKIKAQLETDGILNNVTIITE